MASARATLPLRAGLRISLSRPASVALPLLSKPVIPLSYFAVPRVRSFTAIGVQREKSAGTAAPEAKSWDFDMVRLDEVPRNWQGGLTVHFR